MMTLERKDSARSLQVNVASDDSVIVAGYASVFGMEDKGGDVVVAGAYARALNALKENGGGVKMLWQHDAKQPIGVWDTVHEDAHGLFVSGRLLTDVAKAREAAALLGAGAIDGLSIGYRTVTARKNAKGQRMLSDLELWEVSLVTFPMLPEARVTAKSEGLPLLGSCAYAEALRRAQQQLAT